MVPKKREEKQKKENENVKEIQKRWEKGFTLVELIVVLVILAILAALLVPALTGYIDKAKEKQIIAETRQAVMAAQTIVDEMYGARSDGTDVGDTEIQNKKTEIATLGEVTESCIGDITLDNNKIDTLVYTKNGKTCTYKAEPAPVHQRYKFDNSLMQIIQIGRLKTSPAPTERNV